ncbi:MAG: hypothetical protein AAFQ41_00105 [Cyanobacteria bacterium J06623_7]
MVGQAKSVFLRIITGTKLAQQPPDQTKGYLLDMLDSNLINLKTTSDRSDNISSQSDRSPADI